MSRHSVLAVVAFALILFPAGIVFAEFPDEPSFTVTDVENPRALAVGDVNGDGQADLAVSCRGLTPAKGQKRDVSKAGCFVYYQKNGVFTAPADRKFPASSPRGVKIGDFDSDGETDLAYLSTSRHLTLFLGAEDLNVEHTWFNTNQHSGVYKLQPVRIGKSAKHDFIVGAVWRQWYGENRVRQGYIYGPKRNDNVVNTVVDLNLDDAMDFVFITKDSLVRIYYGPFLTTNVKAADAMELLHLSPTNRPGQLIVADLNHDARPDIIVAGGKARDPKIRNVLIYHQDAPLGFRENIEPSVTIAGGYGHIASADLNGDALDDLIVAESSGSSSKIRVFLQKKDKPFATAIDQADQVITVADRYATACLELADVNGDDCCDMLIGIYRGRTPGEICVYLNQGR